MTDRATPRGSVSTSFWTPVSRSSLLRKKGAVTRVFHSKYLFLSWPGSRRCFLPIVRHERRMCAVSTVSQKFANNYRRPPGTHRTLVSRMRADDGRGSGPDSVSPSKRGHGRSFIRRDLSARRRIDSYTGVE